MTAKRLAKTAAALIVALAGWAAWMRVCRAPEDRTAGAARLGPPRESAIVDPPRPSTCRYFPLADKMHWRYVLRYMLPGFAEKRGAGQVWVDGYERIGDHCYFKVIVKLTGIPGGGTTVSYYRFVDHGIYCVEDQSGDGEEGLFMPLPLHPGRRWTARTPAGTADCRIEKGGTVRGADGVVYPDCLKVIKQVEIGPAVTVDQQWVARGIGPVKKTIRLGSFSGEALLDTYRPGSAAGEKLLPY